MVRQRRHSKETRGNRPDSNVTAELSQQPRLGADQGQSTAPSESSDMQYVNNYRSKARASQYSNVPRRSMVRWLIRLQIVRVLVLVVVVGGVGALLGRYLHYEVHKAYPENITGNSPNPESSKGALDPVVPRNEQNDKAIPKLPDAKQLPTTAQLAAARQLAAQQASSNQDSLNEGNQAHVDKKNPSLLPHLHNPSTQDVPSDVAQYPYHIIQSLTNTKKFPHLKTRFIECTKSILEKASINLHFFFVIDDESQAFVMEALQSITDQQIANKKFQFHLIDINELKVQLAPLVTMLQEHVTGGNPYYTDPIFYLSIALHRGVLPSYVRRVIMLDTDLKFMTDIKGLFDHFDLFTGDNIMGLVREMQPVYRHLLSMYRNTHPGTNVGGPPPDGLTGFNSGVLLLDFEKITRSLPYLGFVNATKIKEISTKYHFKGHLGDQDFFTLISFEKPDLFHVLPCSWNRQLCTWWRDKGYEAVFDQYFTCNQKINIFHGNCNTPIPV